MKLNIFSTLTIILLSGTIIFQHFMFNESQGQVTKALKLANDWEQLAKKAEKDWKGIAEDWKQASNRFENVANDWKDNYLVCKSMLPKS